MGPKKRVITLRKVYIFEGFLHIFFSKEIQPYKDNNLFHYKHQFFNITGVKGILSKQN